MTMRSKLMRAYLPVPHSWYMTLLGINFAAASESRSTAWQQPQSKSDHENLSLDGQDVTAADAHLGFGVICGDRCGESYPDLLSDSC